MSTHEQRCPHCRAKDEPPDSVASIAHTPVELPDVPTPFRVEHDGHTQNCVLHPDGRVTMQINGEVLTSMLTFDDMCERNWATAHIEWNPLPGDATCP